MTAFDDLLTWISSRGKAGNGSVRKTCDWLSAQYGLADRFEGRLDPADAGRKVRWQLLESLNRLGHIEARTGGWEVVPPTLLIRRAKTGLRTGLFYGARNPAWKDFLAGFAGLEFRSRSQLRGPEIWEVRECSEGQLERMAGGLEIALEPLRSLDFLRSVPSFREVLRVGSETKPSPELETFSVFKKGRGWSNGWSRAKDRRAGLFRNRLQNYAAWYFIESDEVYSVPPGERRFIARWCVAALQQPLTMRFADRRLWLPSFGIPLPVLLDRALCANVGHGPQYQDFGWQYSGLSTAHAQELSRILDIKLELS